MSLTAPFDKLRLPVIGSPLFIVSGPELVIAQCKAGIVGAFPALNARPQSELDEWLHRITEELAAYNPLIAKRPFAVVPTKIDAVGDGERLNALQAFCRRRKISCLPVSSATRAGLTELVTFVGQRVEHLRAAACATKS